MDRAIEALSDKDENKRDCQKRQATDVAEPQIG
jgi:hypothetical protein